MLHHSMAHGTEPYRTYTDPVNVTLVKCCEATFHAESVTSTRRWDPPPADAPTYLEDFSRERKNPCFILNECWSSSLKKAVSWCYTYTIGCTEILSKVLYHVLNLVGSICVLSCCDWSSKCFRVCFCFAVRCLVSYAVLHLVFCRALQGVRFFGCCSVGGQCCCHTVIGHQSWNRSQASLFSMITI